MHENFDDEFLVHQIVSYDYNNPDHDNVTCEMEVSPVENNIFQLVHDGSFKHDCKYCLNLTLDDSKGRRVHDLVREMLIWMKNRYHPTVIRCTSIALTLGIYCRNNITI